MPMQGFGVFQVPDATECERVVTDALATGYRLIDTASVYGNERAVGAAIRNSGILREELFITTKAWISEMGYERTLRSFDVSLARLGLDYLDLYLIHMPLGDYYGAWRAMEELYSAGRVRAIGVCNFEPDRLLDLCHNVRVIPAVNQIEMHPYTRQSEAVRIMGELGVQMEAWGPLAEGRVGICNAVMLPYRRRYIGLGWRRISISEISLCRWRIWRQLMPWIRDAARFLICTPRPKWNDSIILNAKHNKYWNLYMNLQNTNSLPASPYSLYKQRES